ncbi:hypothetical protein TNCV_4273201 [Trichonephila clavipes]|nr:hypothetical protein TNCV_4273201 [Trichonephila clavipes]
MTSEMAPPLLTSTTRQREDFKLDKFNMHHLPLHDGSSGLTTLKKHVDHWLRSSHWNSEPRKTVLGEVKEAGQVLLKNELSTVKTYLLPKRWNLCYNPQSNFF